MNRSILSSIAIAAVALAVSLPAAAQKPDIVLVCGGIGLEESIPMRQAQQAHALIILFATEGGGYVTDVRTRIDTKLSGAMAIHENCGPVAQVDVETAGTYRIEGDLGGVVREATVELKPQGGARVVLRWPD